MISLNSRTLRHKNKKDLSQRAFISANEGFENIKKGVHPTAR